MQLRGGSFGAAFRSSSSGGGCLALVSHEGQALLAAACDGSDFIFGSSKGKLQLLHLGSPSNFLAVTSCRKGMTLAHDITRQITGNLKQQRLR